jgi:hypothetical protein
MKIVSLRQVQGNAEQVLCDMRILASGGLQGLIERCFQSIFVESAARAARPTLFQRRLP